MNMGLTRCTKRYSTFCSVVSMTANVKHDMKSRTVLLQAPYLCEYLMHNLYFKKKVTLKLQL